MDAAEVLAVLDALAGAGCRAWVAGGWGVDALVGRQTRPHRDLDLAVDAGGEASALEALIRRGYVIETDWRPVRVEAAAPGNRWVDLHPVVFDEAGDGVQSGLDGGTFFYPAACFVTGTIAGRRVGCLSVEQQLAFHSGYERRDVDVADLALLRALVTRTRRPARP
jgi:lincosamide nucleotidyltransferase A/C/D/E